MSEEDRVFIDCLYKEKDKAKAAGAKWDYTKKKWYIPTHLLDQIGKFNKWRPNGRIYLNCPYKDKDRVKRLGGKWDSTLKKWFYYPGKVSDDDFMEWLPSCDGDVKLPAKRYEGTPTKKKIKAEQGARSPGTAKSFENTLHRVKDEEDAYFSYPTKSTPSTKAARFVENGHNTVEGSHLSGECGAPDPGLSNHLVVGNVTNLFLVNDQSKFNGKRRMQESDYDVHEAEVNMSRTPSKKRKPFKASCINLRILPRINASLTVAQLSHELHYRDPHITGTSNKNKQWFLERLGSGSIWMTSNDVKSLDLNNVPRVSSAMSIDELCAELVERDPRQTGMSGQSKDWFLSQLCTGTIWITS